MGLRRSSFAVDCGPAAEDGKRCYFNTLFRRFISVPDTIEALVSSTGTDGQLVGFLKKGGWITEASDYMEEMRDALRLITTAGARSAVLNVTFTMTTRCNLNCSYCFQNNALRQDADRHVFASLPGFLAAELGLRPVVKKVRLLLFGGEPLLMQPQCLDMLRTVKELCGDLSLSFEGGIITNGLGAAPGFWKNAEELGLQSAQITIDGSERVHDGFRKLDGAGTYRRLLSKFSRLSRELRVELKYNLTGASAECFSEFISDIGSSGFDKKNTRIVLEAVKAIDYNAAQSDHFQAVSAAAAEAYVSCAGTALKSGWHVSLSHVFQPPCMYMQQKPSSILIRPDGSVSRCISVYTNDPDFYGGDILGSGLSGAGENILGAIEKNAINCIRSECPYFPVCLTGCPSAKKNTLKTVDGVLCRRGYLERIISGLASLRAVQPENYQHLCY